MLPGRCATTFGPRRTPGLRREELAALAGVSVDYYIRLEQGKGTGPSGAVLGALATVLQLDEDARDHLYALANHAARRTPPPRTTVRHEVRDGVLLLLETVRPCPAYVLSSVVAWHDIEVAWSSDEEVVEAFES